MPKLTQQFFERDAETVAKNLLGKFLVHNTFEGKISGMINEVEAYPAFSDGVSHSNKRTQRTEVVWGPPGFAYVYLIYGLHYQFSVVVNKVDVPEVVFIRSVIPYEGIDLMLKNYGKTVTANKLTNAPGKLCKAFGINKTFYGLDLTGDKLFFEDNETDLSNFKITESSRIGINQKLEGSSRKLRFKLLPIK